MSDPRPIPFGGLCMAEWRKIRGRGLAYAILLFGLIHGVAGPGVLRGMLALGHKLSGEGELDPADWLVGADLSLYFAVFPINGFVLLLLACILWAEDFSLGTMAMIFVRPVARWKIFAAKATVAWGVSIGSLLVATITGALLGIVLLGFSGDTGVLASAPVVGWIAVFPETGAPAMSPEGLPMGEPLGFAARMGWMAARLGAGALILAPAVAIAALLAQITRSPVLTLFGSILVFVLDGFAWAIAAAWGSSNLDGHELASRIAEWTILGARRGLFRANLEGAIGDLWPSGALTLAYTLIFGGLALWMFNRRDVT